MNRNKWLTHDKRNASFGDVMSNNIFFLAFFCILLIYYSFCICVFSGVYVCFLFFFSFVVLFFFSLSICFALFWFVSLLTCLFSKEREKERIELVGW